MKPHPIDVDYIEYSRIEIGRNIRSRREKLGLSRITLGMMLATVSGCGRTPSSAEAYIRKVEGGDSMSLSRMLMIGDLLSMTPGDMLRGVLSMTDWLEVRQREAG